MEEKAIRYIGLGCQGQGGTRAAHVGGQCPHDGVVPSQTVAVVMIVDDGDLHRHAVEVYYPVDHCWRLGSCHACGNMDAIIGRGRGVTKENIRTKVRLKPDQRGHQHVCHPRHHKDSMVSARFLGTKQGRRRPSRLVLTIRRSPA